MMSLIDKMVKVQLMDVVEGDPGLFSVCWNVLEDARYYVENAPQKNPGDYLKSMEASVQKAIFVVAERKAALGCVISGMTLSVITTAPFEQKEILPVVRKFSAIVICATLELGGDVKAATRGFMEGISKAAFLSNAFTRSGFATDRVALEAAIGIVNATYERHSAAAGEALDVLVPLVCSDA